MRVLQGLFFHRDPFFLNGSARELIAQIVHCVTRMALDPFPGQNMHSLQMTKSQPEVLIFDRLLRARFPAVALPALQPPFREGIFDIGAVGNDVHLGRAL